MTGLVDWAVARSRTVLMMLGVMLVAGYASYVSIPKEADPDIDIPIIYVSIPHPGISPQDSERLLVKPMETVLRSIEGIEKMQSTASEGHAGILLEFDVSFDKDQALIDVREAVDKGKVELPDDTEEPQVLEFNTSLFPVIVVTLSGPAPERTRLKLARELEDVIEGIPTVLEADLQGQRDEQLDVIIDPARLESYNISHRELIQAVTLNNRLIAAGALDTGAGRFSVKIPGLFETRQDVNELVIKTNGDSVVTLGDVTDIRRTFKDATGYARYNGEPAISVSVTKRLGSNLIETVSAVRSRVADAQAAWPEDIRQSVEVNFSLDQSINTLDMLGQLEASVLTAVVLVMILVIAILGLRTAGLVGVAIPSSFLMGFAFLAMLGFTINTMVMFGMILAVGMLVDGAIVVVEFADRKMAEGIAPREAYATASKRMFWPIISSTATTLSAFLPMLLWPGVAGQFMSYLPITLILVLSGSTLMALFFLPVLGGIFGKTEGGNTKTLKALAASETGDLSSISGFTGGYVRVLTRATRHPVLTLVLALGLMGAIVYVFPRYSHGVEFFTDTDPDQIALLVSARGNLAARETRDLVIEVENRLTDISGIRSVLTVTGAGGFADDRDEKPVDVIGQIRVELADWRTRPTGKEIMEVIREKTTDIPGISVEVRKREDGPPTGKDLQIEIASHNEEALFAVTGAVRDHLEQDVDGLIDIEDTRPLPGIEWQLDVDRGQAGLFGADIGTVGSLVQLITHGIEIGEYRPDDSDEEVEIRVRYPVEQRTLDQLDQLRVRTEAGQVPISNFVTRTPVPKVDKIDRMDGIRIMTVRANTEEGVLADDKVREILAWIKEAGLDPRAKVRFRGANEEQRKSQEFLSKAFLGALALMALILVTQFNSFYFAFLILSTVIMATVGVLLGIMITGQTFSIILTGTGVVALAGIVVNNNIVLIDTYQHLRLEGYEPIEAIIRTGAQRLRPVMLTTVTTIAGLLPMVLQFSVGFFDRTISIGAPSSLWWVQLSTAVVFGLAFSTVLTLIITPAALALPWRLKQSYTKFMLRWRKPKSGKHAVPSPENKGEPAYQPHWTAAE